ncbi:MAG: hypothetical protein CL912_24455 [Deltaproteobacteria bacterium]|nr:hypothetical protein [Deltaproteobacteria bacterium]
MMSKVESTATTLPAIQISRSLNILLIRLSRLFARKMKHVKLDTSCTSVLDAPLYLLSSLLFQEACAPHLEMIDAQRSCLFFPGRMVVIQHI